MNCAEQDFDRVEKERDDLQKRVKELEDQQPKPSTIRYAVLDKDGDIVTEDEGGRCDMFLDIVDANRRADHLNDLEPNMGPHEVKTALIWI